MIPAPVNCATVPVAATLPEQFALLYSLTWVGVPPPTVPFTSGLRSLAGESGSVSVIVGAPIEPSTLHVGDRVRAIGIVSGRVGGAGR